MAKLTDTQLAVLRALVRLGTGEGPATAREIAESRECFSTSAKSGPSAWATGHLRALQRKGLAYTDAPGAGKGYWLPTEAGHRALKEEG